MRDAGHGVTFAAPRPATEDVMPELHIVATLHAKVGKENELRRDLSAITEASRRENGNIRYDLLQDRNDARRFVIVEHWRDEAAQDRHHNLSEHIRHFHAHGDQNVERREAVYFLQKIV